MRPVLYSTNVFLKLLIQEKFRNNYHYVWCSEYFDIRKHPAYVHATQVPPSSSPIDLYNRLKEDVKGSDTGSLKIAQQKVSFRSLATDWESRGEISRENREEIFYMTEHYGFDYWRPLIYVIPTNLVEDRLETVPPEKRAGAGTEYIIPDLRRNEFDIIEL